MPNLQFQSWDQRQRSSTASVFSLLKVPLRQKSLVALGIVIGLVIGALFYVQVTPVYEASADVLIITKGSDVTAGSNGSSFSSFEDYMSAPQALIVSPLIVDRTAARPEIAALRTKNIGAGLRVTSSSSEDAVKVLTLSFRGEVPEDCATIVNGVIDTFQEYLDETYDGEASTDTLKLTEEARTLSRELQEQEQAYREFRQKSPFVSAEGGAENPVESRLATIQSQQSELLTKRTELESKLASIKNARDAGRDPSYMRFLIANLGGDFMPPEVNQEGQNSAAKSEAEIAKEKQDLADAMELKLLPLVQREKELLKRFGAGHPQVTSVRAEIDDVRDYYDKAVSQLTDSQPAAGDIAESKDKDTGRDSIQLYVDYLQQELDRITTSQRLLATLYDTQLKAAKESADFELFEAELKSKIGRTQQLYDGVIAQLQTADSGKDFGGFKADVMSAPGFGERVKVRPDPTTIFPISILLGSILGICLAFAADTSSGRFQSAGEISRSLGLPVVAHIRQAEGRVNSSVDPEKTGPYLDHSLCTYHAPNSVDAEAYRELRTTLYVRNRGQGHSVIQVTSPSRGDGKSTVAANLSVSIAQSGKRVLLVDADMREPSQQYLFDLESASGLSTVIAEEEELKDAIAQTAVDNLWLLPSGQLSADPAELLTSPRFGELISVIREHYDYVIVDSGSLLSISDPCIVSLHVDEIVMALRLASSSRKQAERAGEILARLDAPTLGVVVNCVAGPEARRYGYAFSDNDYASYGGHHRRGSGRKSARKGRRVRNSAYS